MTDCLALDSYAKSLVAMMERVIEANADRLATVKNAQVLIAADGKVLGGLIAAPVGADAGDSPSIHPNFEDAPPPGTIDGLVARTHAFLVERGFPAATSPADPHDSIPHLVFATVLREEARVLQERMRKRHANWAKAWVDVTIDEATHLDELGSLDKRLRKVLGKLAKKRPELPAELAQLAFATPDRQRWLVELVGAAPPPADDRLAAAVRDIEEAARATVAELDLTGETLEGVSDTAENVYYDFGGEDGAVEIAAGLEDAKLAKRLNAKRRMREAIERELRRRLEQPALDAKPAAKRSARK